MLKDEIKKGIACDSVGKPDSAVGRAVCLSVHPGKMILFPFLHWFRYHYEGRYKFARLLFAIDLFLIGVMLTLSAIAIYLNVFVPKTFEEQILFESSVAPREITTGAPATIIIRYINTSAETLRNTELSVTFPKHFVLQAFDADHGEITDGERVSIGTVAPGQSGVLHIKGVMFGDVGGEQAFQTKMSFVHGEEKDVFGEKLDWHIFKPSRSALALSLELPERLTAFQPIEGTVRYHNTSDVDFPIVSLLPQWPDAFAFIRTDATFRQDQFEIPAVKAGETGEFRFEGILNEDKEEVMFIFHPSFTFGEDRYKQNTLTHTAPVVPLPLVLTTTTQEKTIIPGATVPVEIIYKNTTEFPVTNVVLTAESDSPFVKEISTHSIEVVEPNEESTVEIAVKTKSSLSSTQTNVYEQLTLALRATASYALADSNGQNVVSKSQRIDLPVTTPVRLEAFARYTAPSGDQIGRGPVPPVVGEETTYWIFWHIGGTTNELTDIRLEGTLANGVRFTGKQTVSQNGSVVYDEKTKTVTWISPDISPTLSPQSKIIGIAFELGITPEEPSSSPIPLFKDIRLTGVDGWTGAFVSASAPTIYTPMKK